MVDAEPYAMDPSLKSFVSIAFSAEVAGSLEDVRRGLPRRGEAALLKLRADFRDLVDNRRLTLREFCMMSDLDFDTEVELYSYLHAAYDYLFENAETPPDPPWF
ncbi:hypothetical protein [Microlunatus sp. GCM10028923]|uniref:hypothetical protein n=1 Tax=Microlunatus sp. GCM10028923 TaxID=3273400 RepID=UPI00361437B4